MIYAIGDLHFDYSKSKPMDIFGDNWIDHEEQIIKNWENKITDDDIVLIPGDISWALKLEEAVYDLKRIDRLPGKKILTKGNHDYWWQSLKKMEDLALDSISFIQNNHFQYKNFLIGGSRGWMDRDSEGFKESDEKIFNRELLRLDMSLSKMKTKTGKKIVLLHYPPFGGDLRPNKFVDIMKKYDVDICIYGHLHSEGHKYAVEGNIQGINFHCVASDFINFDPKLIMGE